MAKIESVPEELSIKRLPRNEDGDYQNEWQLCKGDKILRIHSLDIDLIIKLLTELRAVEGDAIQAGTPHPDFAFMDKEEEVEVFARVAQSQGLTSEKTVARVC